MQNFKKNAIRMFGFVGILVLSLTVLTTVFAADVVDYTNKTTITVDGQPLTADTKISTGKALEATNNISFPDTQQINEGDVLVLDLPKELGLITKLAFPITHSSGEVIANAVTDPSTQKVTITFTDYFSKNYKDKVMSLKYSVRPNVTNLPESGKYTFQFGTENYTLNYDKTDGEAGDYEMKYGFQDKLNNMVIKDDFSDSGQVLVESSFRAVRYATQPEKIPNEAALLKLEPIDNFSKKAEFTRNADGKITGFTINFGDNWNWAMYIEYTTELTSELPKGTKVANVLEWSASNFNKSRSIEALTRLETGSGEGSGDRTTTTTTSTTTTTEEPSTTSTTTTTEEPSTTSTTTTTEAPSTTSTTTTTEAPPTTSTTTTTEEPTTTSTTTTTEGPATTSTTTTEEPTTTSTTTTTEEPTTTSTTTTTEELTTTSTTTTTEEPATTSTTTTEEPTTSSTTTTPEGSTQSTEVSSTTTTDDKPQLPKTGETVEAGLVTAGVFILSAIVVLNRRYNR